jgi:DNA primase
VIQYRDEEATPANRLGVVLFLSLTPYQKEFQNVNTSTVSQSVFVDFKEVKSRITIVQILERYDLMPSLKRSADRLSGPCPLHGGTNVTQFRVSISKNCWNCFGTCGRGGNIIDFVSLREGVPFRDAALLLQEWFMPDKATAKVAEVPPKPAPSSPPIPPSQPPPGAVAADDSRDDDGAGENPPLSFELKSLQNDHPYLSERGLNLSTVQAFGVGYCPKGYLRGYIAIPIRNQKGEIVAYVGRWPGTPPDGTPKYKLPKGFRKSLEVFNLHRASKEAEDEPLVIVEGYFDVMRLWQLGLKRVVALMGSSLSKGQEELLRRSTRSESRIAIMFDEDDAGRKGREQALIRLSAFAHVQVIALPRDAMQPEHLDAEQLANLFP